MNPMPARTSRFSAAVAAGAIALVVAALALGACTAPTREETAPSPSGVASITGNIASVQLPTILVVAQGEQPGGSDRASVRVHPGTRVLWRSGRAASSADLRVGQAVRVWYDGPVMESYPIQTTAGAIVIDSPP